MSSAIKKRILEGLDEVPEERLPELARFLDELRAKKLPGSGFNDRSPRPFGLCAGDFHVTEAFDEPLPEELLKAFEGR